MHKISLKDWVFFLTILPTTIIGITLAGYFSYNRYIELDNFLQQQATSIIEPIAIASADALIQRDREKLRKLIGFAHRSHSSIIRSAAIFTKNNQVFVSSTYHGDTNAMRLHDNQSISSGVSIEPTDSFYIYRAPIIIETDNTELMNNNSSDKQIIGYVAMQVDTGEIYYVQQQELIMALIIVLVGSVISAFFALGLIQNVTRPISSMIQAIDRIREGKLESRVSGQLIGELNFLKNGINAMAQSLSDYRNEMQKSVDQATHDLRESLEQFELQNVALDMAKRRAQEANKVKSEFLANMSHELRTPLNGVLGFTRQTLKTPLNDVQRDYLQTIERSANNLLVLINDILDFSKLDAGKMIIEKIPFSLREAVEEALILLAPSAHNKHIELSLLIDNELPDSLIGDAMRIKQVLINLTNNAIKFTENGSVTIDITVQSLTLEEVVFKVSVADTGIGMTQEQRKSLFDAFSQADKSVTRLYGGTGLGLVISQRLSKEMDGDIGFTSQHKRGSNFWFTCKCELNPIPMSNPLPVANLSNKTILYFEQHQHSRIATSEILSNWHMKVTQISATADLFEILNGDYSFDYALIGHDVSPSALIQLKKLISEISEKVPEVYVAINSNAPYLQESLIIAGATNCLSKPITPSRLCKALTPKNLALPNLANQPEIRKIPIKVLAVDDNEANLKLIVALLSEHVTDVSTAENGQEAVELCQSEKFAIIFMDIQMPIMDGVTALKNIKQNTLNEDTPIIAVTAHALNEEKNQLLNDGFCDYVTKPIDEAILRHSLYEYCDLELINSAPAQQTLQRLSQVEKQQKDSPPAIFDWQLALSRSAHNQTLAKEMFTGLLKSLPETKIAIQEAITSQDTERVKQLIHKLNGACCYTGVPNLSNVTAQIETELKNGTSLDDLDPEWFEFYEHIDAVINNADKFFPIKENNKL